MNETDEKQSKEEGIEPFGPVIFSYTRAQAIEDGVLIDVTDAAKEAGFLHPFSMTAEAWGLIEDIPSRYGHEDVQGRLWDVLTLARYAILKMGKGVYEVCFEPILHHNGGDTAKFKLHIGPGDSGEPVLTLMLPWQD